MNKIILRKKLVTEKSTSLQAGNTYILEVTPAVTKTEIKSFLNQRYSVVVDKVRVVNVLGKKVRIPGKRGYALKRNWKKAYVTIKEGSLETLGENK